MKKLTTILLTTGLYVGVSYSASAALVSLDLAEFVVDNNTNNSVTNGGTAAALSWTIDAVGSDKNFHLIDPTDGVGRIARPQFKTGFNDMRIRSFGTLHTSFINGAGTIDDTGSTNGGQLSFAANNVGTPDNGLVEGAVNWIGANNTDNNALDPSLVGTDYAMGFTWTDVDGDNLITVNDVFTLVGVVYEDDNTVSMNGITGDALDIVAGTVPEPSSTALLGLAGLSFLVRRKRA